MKNTENYWSISQASIGKKKKYKLTLPKRTRWYSSKETLPILQSHQKCRSITPKRGENNRTFWVKYWETSVKNQRIVMQTKSINKTESDTTNRDCDIRDATLKLWKILDTRDPKMGRLLRKREKIRGHKTRTSQSDDKWQ